MMLRFPTASPPPLCSRRCLRPPLSLSAFSFPRPPLLLSLLSLNLYLLLGSKALWIDQIQTNLPSPRRT
ncbi:hypothetical protein B296_00055670 [Ensete ventricosum]|uniref:Uncharacterized protein n=1 Tax=Ensete ventricosum TaxID=4639 RepID=A0A426XYF4_ENSVE|nr:hypothetical protein B296_00055670 [Ensete ventricosum]